MNLTNSRIGLFAAVGLLAVVLAGCAGNPVTPAAAGATGPGSVTATAGSTVSANTASQAGIAAAFTAAGISNADRWAKEVVEYRPYQPGATAFTQLRAELAKYNPDPATIDAIVAVLTP